MFQWLRSLFSQRATKLSASHPRDPNLRAFFVGPTGDAGVHVDEHTAMMCSAVWAAVWRISSAVGAMPLHAYERTEGRGKKSADAHPSATILRRPNPMMLPSVFLETLQHHVLTHGNAYCEIERTNGDRPLYLWPLPPNRVEPKVTEKGDGVEYVVHVSDRPVRLASRDVLHVPGLGYDGIRGYNVIRHAAQSIGLAIAAEKYGAGFFGSDARPAAILTHPGTLDDEHARDRIIRSWDEAHGGLDRKHRVALLEEGMTYTRIAVTPEEAQFLASRQFQVTDVARWFAIQPHLIGDLSRATFSNIEHQGTEFVTYTLMPWLVRWQQELSRKLFDDGNRYFVEFLTAGLLRGDLKSRYDAYNIGRVGGWLTRNDVLRAENLPLDPSPDGDAYLTPLNMTPSTTTPEPKEPTTDV